MKQKLPFLMFLLLLFGMAGSNAQQVIAHRGFWKTEGSAQNSIASLMKADSIGVYGSEVDVWLSSDGIPIVNHDADVTLEGRKLKVQETPFATLQKVTLSNGESLPSFDEYLNAFAGCKTTRLIIELKPHSSKEREDALVAKVMEMVQQKTLEERVEYISFSLNLVRQVRMTDARVPVYYLNGDLTPQVLDTLQFNGADYHFNVIKNHPEWVEMAHKLGQKINVWTVNQPEDIQKMIELKVDFITTDEPVSVMKAVACFNK